MPLTDTSAAAREVYYRRLAEMTPAERVRAGIELWVAGDALQRGALRRRYPEADDSEINFRLAESRYGSALARKVYGRP